MRLLFDLLAVACLSCTVHVHATGSAIESRPRPPLVQASPRIAFALNADSMDWNEAFKQCKDWNMTLAFPTSEFDGEMLESFLTNDVENTTKEIHMGFHSQFVQGYYVTVQGWEMDEVGYWRWDPASDNATEHRCGALSVGGMKNIDCATRQESVCQAYENLYYDTIGDFGVYRLHERALNWSDAVSVCKIEGAYVLILRSEEEFHAVFDHYAAQGLFNVTVDLWYGAHQLFADSVVVTLADELVSESGFDAWASDSGDAGLPLVGVRLADVATPGGDAGLFSAPWGTPMPYVCKRELHWS